jgi:hypothetical protein
MLAFRIGQAVPAFPRRQIVTEIGGERWHALKCYPQMEYRAKCWLGRHGALDALYPVKRDTKTQMGRKVTREIRFVPGLVFARFPGEPVWANLLDSPFVYDAIRLSTPDRNGILWPGILHESTIEAIKEMRDRGEPNGEKWRVRIVKGARVRFRKGAAMEGREGEEGSLEVREVGEGTATLTVTMFGAPRDLPFSFSDLELVAPPKDAPSGT